MKSFIAIFCALLLTINSSVATKQLEQNLWGRKEKAGGLKSVYPGVKLRISEGITQLLQKNLV